MEVNELLLALYRAAREVPLDRFHDSALAVLRSAVRFDSAIWGTGVMRRTGLQYGGVHLHNEPEDLPQHYAEVAHQDAASFHLLALGPRFTDRFHSPTLYREREFAAMRAYVRRFRHQNTLVTGESLDGSNVAWLALYRAQPDALYVSSDASFVSLVAPHMQEALRTACVLHLERSGREREAQVRVIADSGGVIQHADPAFGELLRAEWPHWKGPALPSELSDSLRARREYRGREIVVTCQQVSALVLMRIRRRSRIDSLTPRERDIAIRLQRGHSHKQIARTLDLSPATVRNHLQNIHRKLGVHSNAEVAAQLAAAGQPED